MTTALSLSAFSSIEQYFAAVNRIPMLTPDEEADLLARKDVDVDAAYRLTTAYLRLIIPVARKYEGYGLPIEDLVQEGNIGLMKAIKHFDPSRGVKLVTYAMYWIKSEIHEFIVRNWRMVKIATTKAQRKLFFNLRKLRENPHRSLTSDEIARIAQELDVNETDVREMEVRISGGDVTINVDEDDDDSRDPLQNVGSGENLALAVEDAEIDGLRREALAAAIDRLGSREKRIITARWLTETPVTLKDLAEEFGVSIERIRQVEAKTIKELKRELAAYHE